MGQCTAGFPTAAWELCNYVPTMCCIGRHEQAKLSSIHSLRKKGSKLSLCSDSFFPRIYIHSIACHLPVPFEIESSSKSSSAHRPGKVVPVRWRNETNLRKAADRLCSFINQRMCGGEARRRPMNCRQLANTPASLAR